MFNKLFKLLILLTFSTLSAQLNFEAKHVRSTQWINAYVKQVHYKNLRLDDNFSAVIYHRYLSDLDYNKAYLLESDINEFKGYEFQFDDFIQKGDLRIPFDIFNRFKSRFDTQIEKIFVLIEKDFDFTKKEKFYYDREDATWAKSSAELDEYWRKRIKNEILNLKISGKKIKGIREILSKRYKNYERHFNQFKNEDVYQLFMNSYLESIDPHTNYMSPRNSENFNIQMRLSLEGIGAQLRTENEFTKVVRIIKGGPADMDGELQADDKIIAVAQGENEYVDVIGWRIDDVVNKIRGKKGSMVRLKIIPAGSTVNDPTQEIVLIRDKVKLEEQAAKASIKEIEQNGKKVRLGIIDLPAFYIDFAAARKGDPNYKSSSRDVHILLDSLKREGVDGVVVDLRNNGGGSLQEAVELSGLFIDKGAVVQVRNKKGRVDVLEDEDKGLVYDGPLAVLINQHSASASEIFSAAMQDYQRGLVIGVQSFGKGTVQRIFDLNQQIRDAKVGQIKLTTSKFYRISGESTQHKGVIPDIVFPSLMDHDHYGESSLDHALIWDQISKSDFKKMTLNPKLLSKVYQNHKKRINKNIYFKELRADIAEYKARKDENFISLNEKERVKEREENQEKRRLKINKIRQAKGQKAIKKGEKLPSDKSDYFLDETTKILADFVKLIKDA